MRWLTQLASVTGVVGVSFVVTLFASVVNYIWEEGIRAKTAASVIVYGIAVVIITSAGMFRVERIVTADQTVRVAAGLENYNLLLEDKSILAEYSGSDEEKTLQANADIITRRAKQAVQNESTLFSFS